MARCSILSVALLVLALYGSLAFISAPSGPSVPRSAAAGIVTAVVAAQPALADEGGDVSDGEPAFYLVGFFLLGFFGLAKSVFDAGNVKYNLTDATGQGRK